MKYCGPVGRIRSLIYCLTSLNKWSENEDRKVKDIDYTIKVAPKFRDLLEEIEK
jgi:hypothetical protein